MLYSDTTIGSFLDDLIADMGLFTDRDRAAYRALMNDGLGFLYGSIIRKPCEGLGYPASGILPYVSIPAPQDAGAVRPQDILAVYRGTRQLRYLPPQELAVAKEMAEGFYTVTDRGIELPSETLDEPLRVMFVIRPPRYGQDEEGKRLPLPAEFVPMLGAWIRGETYRLVGEDALCAKWLGVYNAMLEDFYRYLGERGLS